MKKGLRAHFIRTNRGFFNWDAMYGRYRSKANNSDHFMDMAKDDQAWSLRRDFHFTCP